MKISYKVTTFDKDSKELSVDYFTDNYVVGSYMEISDDAFHIITSQAGLDDNSTHVMMIVMILVAVSMVIIGALLGIYIAHKLWRGSTSFGYMIHSNVM